MVATAHAITPTKSSESSSSNRRRGDQPADSARGDPGRAARPTNRSARASVHGRKHDRPPPAQVVQEVADDGTVLADPRHGRQNAKSDNAGRAADRRKPASRACLSAIFSGRLARASARTARNSRHDHNEQSKPTRPTDPGGGAE